MRGGSNACECLRYGPSESCSFANRANRGTRRPTRRLQTRMRSRRSCKSHRNSFPAATVVRYSSPASSGFLRRDPSMSLRSAWAARSASSSASSGRTPRSAATSSASCSRMRAGFGESRSASYVRLSARVGVSLTAGAEAAALGAPVDFDPVAFEEAVTARLQAGAFQLVIAVDSITDELKRTVSYLNQHTSASVSVLALELT